MSTDLTALAQSFKDTLIAWAPDLVAAAGILVLGWWLAKILTGVLRRGLGRAKIDPILTAFLGNLAYMALLALVVISALGRLGVNTTSFAAILAAGGLAIGLALQGSLGNFASGALLIFFRPFKAGDFIEAGGTSGSVQEIRVFATVLLTADNKSIIVPNSAITDGNIINYSANPTRRVDMVFGIGYDDDIRKAKEILTEILAADERILKDPAPRIAVAELADSSVNFNVRPWVKTADYWDVYWDLTEKVKLAFDDNGISIPYPQRDVHVFQKSAEPIGEEGSTA